MKSNINIVVGYSVLPAEKEKKIASLSPYDNHVVDVHMIIPTLEKAITYRSAGRGEGSGKLSVLGAAASFIKKHSYDVGLSPTFVGFDVGEFLRFVGFDCALSHTFFPSNYWMHKQCLSELHDYLGTQGSDVTKALQYFSKGFSGDDLEKYTELVKGWRGHVDAEHDAQLSCLFGSIFWLWGTP
tara:strand:- start:15179 stop:15730 length:552 start_codon:yes stop_codon:yes gene_type:complete